MSWAEDEGIDGWDGLEPIVSDSAPDEWEDREFNITPIKDLETSHIQNIIRGLEEGSFYWGQQSKLSFLKAELERRSKI